MSVGRGFRSAAALLVAACMVCALAPPVWACSATAEVGAVGVNPTVATPTVDAIPCPSTTLFVNLPPPLPTLNFIGSIVVNVTLGG